VKDLIEIKTDTEIEIIKQSAKIASDVLKILRKNVVPGISTKKLDNLANELIRNYNAEPAFLGYNGFPATICTSINNELVHGIPSDNKILKNGDIITIDLGVKYKGYYGDIAETIPVGKINQNIERLLKVTYNCFNVALKYCYENNRIGDIAYNIQTYVEKNGFSVIRKYVGHGIGRQLHEKPEVPNFGKPNVGPLLMSGMVLAIEPMVAEGSYDVTLLDDNWTVVTMDNKLCAHYEHMILITKDGPVVLTELETKFDDEKL